MQQSGTGTGKPEGEAELVHNNPEGFIERKGGNVMTIVRADGARNSLLLSESYLAFNRDFGVHGFTLMGGYSYQKSAGETWRGRGQSYVTDAALTIILAGHLFGSRLILDIPNGNWHLGTEDLTTICLTNSC